MNKPADLPSPPGELARRFIKVLDLIVAEFNSDPMSVQCFDARTVAEAKACIAERREMERQGYVPPVLLPPEQVRR